MSTQLSKVKVGDSINFEDDTLINMVLKSSVSKHEDILICKQIDVYEDTDLGNVPITFVKQSNQIGTNATVTEVGPNHRYVTVQVEYLCGGTPMHYKVGTCSNVSQKFTPIKVGKRKVRIERKLNPHLF